MEPRKHGHLDAASMYSRACAALFANHAPRSYSNPAASANAVSFLERKFKATEPEQFLPLMFCGSTRFPLAGDGLLCVQAAVWRADICHR